MENQNEPNRIIGFEPQNNGSNGKSKGGFVCSLLSVIAFIAGFFTFWSWLVGLVLAIVGLVLSVMGAKQNKNGLATAGLVLGILGIVFNAIFFISCGVCVLVADGVNDAVTSLSVM